MSSPVGNILLSNRDFIDSVQKQFARQYGVEQEVAQLGDDLLEDENVRKGYDELKVCCNNKFDLHNETNVVQSLDWTFLQTPQFSLATKNEAVPGIDLDLTVRNGAISGVSLANEQGKDDRNEDGMLGRKVHEIESWSPILESSLHELDQSQKDRLSQWLGKMLPRVTY